MTIKQCQGVVLHGRDGSGNRAGLIPPRRCNRPANKGTYCGLHARQSEMQDLLRQCLSPAWEHHVKFWQDQKRREAEGVGLRIAFKLASLAQDQKSYQLSAFLGANAREIARVWAAPAVP